MPKGQMNRVAYFVPAAKRDGLAVGPVFDEGLDVLIRTLEECRDQGRKPVFFLWKNEPDPEKNRKSIATLTIAVGQDRPDNSTGRKPINSAPRTGGSKSSAIDSVFGGTKSEASAKKGW